MPACPPASGAPPACPQPAPAPCLALPAAHPHAPLPHPAPAPAAGVLLQLAAREEALGIVPDPELDAFMKAHAFGGSHSLAVELMLHMLGLQGCADTVVGNEMMRGISGG